MTSVRRNWWSRGWLVAAMAVAAASASACSTKNGNFCDEESPCEANQRCVDSTCVAGFDANSAPAVCAENHACVALAPEGWTGPLARAVLETGEVAPICADVIQGGLLAGLEFDDTASCECSCTTASEVTCGAARLESLSGSTAGCQATVCQGPCPGQDLAPNDCVFRSSPPSGATTARVRFGALSGGRCIDGATTQSFSEAEFTSYVALCEAALLDSELCGENQGCMQSLGDGFAAARCIYQEGDHECPDESPYSEKLLAFDSLQDERACGDCECELPAAGSSCGGAVHSCSEGADHSQSSQCATLSSWGAIAKVEYIPDPADVNCEPINAAPEVNGELTPTGPVTVCCEP